MLITFAMLALLGLVLAATLPAATVMVRTGILVSGALPTASASSDKFANNGKQYLLIANGDNGAHVVTIHVTETVDGQTVTNPTVSIAAGETKLLGPFKPSVYNDGSGFVTVTTDVTTSQTVQVLQAETAINQ